MAGRRNRRRKKHLESGPVLVKHPFSDVDRDALRAALTDLAIQKAAEFPGLLERARALLRARSPKDILATTAVYALQTGVTDERVGEHGFAGRDIGQHHVEILQALALSIPSAEWGTELALPEHIQQAFELTEALNDAFHMRRFSQIEGIEDQDELTVKAIQERLRLHTQIVRNWGYFSRVVAISKDLHAPFDQAVKAHLELTISDIIDLFLKIVRTVEERCTKRFQMLQRVFRERKPKDMIRAYYKANPHFTDNRDDLIRQLAPILHDRQQIGAIILSHFDLVLAGLFTFTPQGLAGICNLDSAAVAAVLRRLSLAPGDLVGADPEHFFMTNPIWMRPLVALGGEQYFCALPQMFFSFVHEILETLIGDINQTEQLERRRAGLLESSVREVVTRTFGDATIVSPFEWEHDGHHFETDLVFARDAYIVIIEAKSGTVSAPALRGATDRVKRHIQELVVHPSQQSARLERVLRDAMAGDEAARAIVAGLGFDLARAKHVLRLSVTLTHLSVLTSLETTFKRVGWLENDHELAVNMSLADFECVLDLLQPLPHFLNYLSDRGRLQRTVDMEGDELDWLGFYLDTGFNIATTLDEIGGIVITGMSKKVDQYYIAKDAGLSPAKPRPRLTLLWREALTYLANRRFVGWTECAVELLRSASFEEQRRIEHEFDRICARVPRIWRQADHISCVVVTPPTARNGAIIFYAYPNQLAAHRHETAHTLASHGFEHEHVQRCIVFGRQVPNPIPPISFVGVYVRPQPA